MSEWPSGQLERFPLDNLTPDEARAIVGIPFESLGQTFLLGDQTFQACTSVWDSKSVKKRVRKSDAVERTYNHFSNLKDLDDNERSKWLKSIARLDSWAVTTEFTQQFYREGSDVVVGRIHEGEPNEVVYRGELDGIPDPKSIVNIHKHPNNLPQSFGDLIGILADEENIPQRCMYFVVCPNEIYLMFPTSDSPRIKSAELSNLVKRYIDRYLADETLDFADQICKFARAYSLGFFSSSKTRELQRMP